MLKKTVKIVEEPLDKLHCLHNHKENSSDDELKSILCKSIEYFIVSPKEEQEGFIRQLHKEECVQDSEVIKNSLRTFREYLERHSL